LFKRGRIFETTESSIRATLWDFTGISFSFKDNKSKNMKQAGHIAFMGNIRKAY
jgi:hypothetical protein